MCYTVISQQAGFESNQGQTVIFLEESGGRKNFLANFFCTSANIFFFKQHLLANNFFSFFKKTFFNHDLPQKGFLFAAVNQYLI